MGFACRSILPDPASASPEQVARASHAVLEIVAAAESDVARSKFVAEAAEILGIPQSALQRDFERLLRRQSKPPAGSPEAPPAPTDAGPTPEEHLLLLCLHFEKIGKALSTALPHDWIGTGHPAGVLLNRFLSEIEQGAWPGKDRLEGLLETPAERALVASLLFELPTFDEPVKIAIEGVRQLRARALEPRLRQIELALAACRDDSSVDALSLLKESLELQRKLRQQPVLAVAE
jgi:DNA primase